MDRRDLLKSFGGLAGLLGAGKVVEASEPTSDAIVFKIGEPKRIIIDFGTGKVEFNASIESISVEPMTIDQICTDSLSTNNWVVKDLRKPDRFQIGLVSDDTRYIRNK